MRPASAVGSRNTTRSRHVPPSTSRAAMIATRTVRPSRSRRASRRSMSRASARSSWGPDADSGSSSDSSSVSPTLRGRSGVSRPAREIVGDEPGGTEAIPQRGALQRRDLPERADAEPLQRLREGRRRLPPAQQRDGHAREIGRPRDLPGPARAGLLGRGHRGEPRRPQADARRAGVRPREGRAHRGDDTVDVPAVQPAQARGVEARLAGTDGLHPRADALEPGEHALPRVGDTDRIGWDEMQRRAAGEGLAHPHAGMDAEGLGGRGDLPHELLATGLGRERRRVPEQCSPAAGGDRELEAWKAGRRRS